MPPGRRFQERGRKRHTVDREGNKEDNTRDYYTRQGMGKREPRHNTDASRRWSRRGRRNDQSREIIPGRQQDFSNKYRSRQPWRRRGRIQKEDGLESVSQGANNESGSTSGILLEREMKL